MSVLVFHPSTAFFVQQVARSLLDLGCLERFITTLRDDPLSAPQRLACLAGRMAGRDLRRQFRRRAITEIPLEKVSSILQWRELLRLAVGAIDGDGRATDWVWEKSEKAFDRGVSRRLHAGLTGVYGFEFASLETFRRAREQGIAVAYEVPGPEPGFVHGLLEKELEKFPEMRTAYHRHTAAREEARTARRRAEWACADLIIASSRFTRDSYARANLDVSKVRVVPLGAPPPVSFGQTGDSASEDGLPLRLLWAGTFGMRKGAHYLLEAWRRGGYGKHARLSVYGAVALPDRVLRPIPSGIELHGSIPRAELLDRYATADALVFPTLCDGFGMVVNEAWSRGVPVITTDRAGAADLLRDRINGLLIPAADPEALGQAIEWCLDHRMELRAMREPARATAAAWQWSDFRRAHGAVLRESGLFDRPSVP
jgi:glycosyltransferase involved in cell wall biosynthesis